MQPHQHSTFTQVSELHSGNNVYKNPCSKQDILIQKHEKDLEISNILSAGNNKFTPIGQTEVPRQGTLHFERTV